MKKTMHIDGKMLRKKAFTLVELLIVMVIIGILIGLAAFGLGAAQRSGRNTNRKNDVRNIVNAFQVYASKSGGIYPPSSKVTCSGSTLTISDAAVIGNDLVVNLKTPGVNCALDSSTSGAFNTCQGFTQTTSSNATSSYTLLTVSVVSPYGSCTYLEDEKPYTQYADK